MGDLKPMEKSLDFIDKLLQGRCSVKFKVLKTR